MPVDSQRAVDQIMELLDSAGGFEYHGERVSQLEHALQCAHLARTEGGSEEEIIAALLHDIGHIWPVEERQVTRVGVVQHDAIGAAVLRQLGFSEAVAETVGGHVKAKRFLVATDSEYASRLSDVSVASLKLQGGPMSPNEADSFANTAHGPSAVRVRVWDDRAKTPGIDVPGLESYRQLLTDHLSRHMAGS